MKRILTFGCITALMLSTPFVYATGVAPLIQARELAPGAAATNMGAQIVYPGGSIQSALTALAATGGEVLVKAGNYSPPTTLVMSSHTKIRCEPGVHITFNSVGWTNLAMLGVFPKMGIVNEHHEATSLTDTDLVVDGCAFEGVNGFNNGGFHAINFQYASKIRIHSVDCLNMGDCTAMMSTDDTVVSDSSAMGMLNACWDHWGGPTNLFVRNNVCRTLGYGILATGSHTVPAPGIADGGDISGNRIYMMGVLGNSGIIVNGLGLAGNGAINIKVHDNVISGAAIHICLAETGLSHNNSFTNNTCYTTGAGYYAGPDTGGTPHDSVVSQNTFDNVGTPTGSVIKLGGDNLRAFENRIIGSTYGYCLWLSNASNVAVDNQCDTPLSSVFKLAGATNPVAVESSGDFVRFQTLRADNTSPYLSFYPLPTSFDTLTMDCVGIVPASNNITAGLQFGQGATPTWLTASYRYSGMAFGNGTATNPFSASASQIQITSINIGSSGSLSFRANISLKSSIHRIVSFTSTYEAWFDSPSLTVYTGAGSYTGDFLAPTALRLVLGAGNIVSGDCTLYGLRSN